MKEIKRQTKSIGEIWGKESVDEFMIWLKKRGDELREEEKIRKENG